MQEAEAGALLGIAAGSLEQAEGAHEVGHDEVLGTINAAIDVALGSEVHHGVDLVLAEQAGEERSVQDVALNEDVARIVLECGEIGEITRVGELVVIDDLRDGHATLRSRRTEEVVDEIGTDEAGTAGDKDTKV